MIYAVPVEIILYEITLVVLPSGKYELAFAVHDILFGLSDVNGAIPPFYQFAVIVWLYLFAGMQLDTG